MRKFELKSTKYPDLLYRWLGISKKSINTILNSHRNAMFWKEKSLEEFEFNGLSQIYRNLNFDNNENTDIPISQTAKFHANSDIIRNREREYIIVGIGYP